MQLKIRRYTGLNSYSFGEISIGDQRYEIAYAHFWQKAAWRIYQLDPKQERYVFTHPLKTSATIITNAENVGLGRVTTSDYNLVEFELFDQNHSLKVESQAELLIASNERWSMHQDGEQIGSMTYKEPFARLDAEAELANPEVLILSSAILWMNRERHLRE
ncbi:hypothetical protein [Cerasicoccus frondis]|uniref:hypothetical protein n=1 Tax=Cerasicoccus frondis TaxID=490090 RepID=UPI002852593A|nr:hypothetical protein [Cerasicoccus frondis]